MATRILKENILKGVVYNDKQLKRMQEIHVDMMESVRMLLQTCLFLFNHLKICYIFGRDI